uniref:Uncharacterized protein n=1 Tax=Arundo donax TaxID=35708 RepID=A0A0A9DZN2_ARUDO
MIQMIPGISMFQKFVLIPKPLVKSKIILRKLNPLVTGGQTNWQLKILLIMLLKILYIKIMWTKVIFQQQLLDQVVKFLKIIVSSRNTQKHVNPLVRGDHL